MSITGLTQDHVERLTLLVQGKAVPFQGMNEFQKAFDGLIDLDNRAALSAQRRADKEVAQLARVNAAAAASARDYEVAMSRMTAAASTSAEKRLRSLAQIDATHTRITQSMEDRERLLAEREAALTSGATDKQIASYDRRLTANQRTIDRLEAQEAEYYRRLDVMQQQANARAEALDVERIKAAQRAQSDATALAAQQRTAQQAQQTASSALRNGSIAAGAGALGTGLLGTGALMLGAGAAAAFEGSKWATLGEQTQANTNLTGSQILYLQNRAQWMARLAGVDPSQFLTAYRYQADLQQFGPGNENWGLLNSSVLAGTKLALPTGANLPDTQAAIAVVQKNFPQWAGDPNAIANMLLQAARNSRMNVEDLVKVIPQTLVTAGHYGAKNLPQALAAVSTLTAAYGGNADEANTAIYNLYSRIATPPPRVQQALLQLKAQGVDLTGDFSYQGLSSKGLIGVLQDIHNANLNPAVLRKLFPYMRSYLGALGLTGNQEGNLLSNYASIQQAPQQNPIGSNWNNFLKLPSTQFHQMEEEIKVDAQMLGRDVLPIFTAWLKDMDPLLKDLDSFIQHNQELFKTLVSLSPVLLAVGGGWKLVSAGFRTWTEIQAGEGILGALATKLDLVKSGLDDVQAPMRTLQGDMAAVDAETRILAVDNAASGEAGSLGALSSGLGTAAGQANRLSDKLTTLKGDMIAAEGAASTSIGATSVAAGAAGGAVDATAAEGAAAAGMSGVGILGLAGGFIALGFAVMYAIDQLGKFKNAATGITGTNTDSGFTAYGVHFALPPPNGYKGGANGMTGGQLATKMGVGQGLSLVGTPTPGFFGLPSQDVTIDSYAAGLNTVYTAGIPTTGGPHHWEAPAAHYDVDTVDKNGRATTGQAVRLPGTKKNIYTLVRVWDYARNGQGGERSLGLTQTWMTPNGGLFIYGHLSTIAPIPPGSKVYGGQIVAYTGFEIEHGQPVDHLHFAADSLAMQYFRGASAGPVSASAGNPTSVPSGLAGGESKNWPLYTSAGSAYGVSPFTLAAINTQESQGNPANLGVRGMPHTPVAQISGAASSLRADLNWTYTPAGEASMRAHANILKQFGITDLTSDQAHMFVALAVYNNGSGAWWHAKPGYDPSQTPTGPYYAQTVLNRSNSYSQQNGANTLPNAGGGSNGNGSNVNLDNPIPTTPAGWATLYGQRATAEKETIDALLKPYLNPDGTVDWARVPKSTMALVLPLLKQYAGNLYQQFKSQETARVASGAITQSEANAALTTYGTGLNEVYGNPEGFWGDYGSGKAAAKKNPFAVKEAAFQGDYNKQLKLLHSIIDNPQFKNADGSINWDALKKAGLLGTVQAIIKKLALDKYGVEWADANIAWANDPKTRGRIITADWNATTPVFSNPQAWYTTNFGPGGGAGGNNAGRVALPYQTGNCPEVAKQNEIHKKTQHNTHSAAQHAAKHTAQLADLIKETRGLRHENHLMREILQKHFGMPLPSKPGHPAVTRTGSAPG